jgi:hypothetical protein
VLEQARLSDQIDGWTENPAGTAVDAHGRNAHQCRWRTNRNGPKEQLIRQRKDRRVRADAECERADCTEGECRIATELAGRVSDGVHAADYRSRTKTRIENNWDLLLGNLVVGSLIEEAT